MNDFYQDDSLSLHTDLYQINMAKSYWQDGIHNRRAVFDLYFRKLPFANGYAIFAGLEKVIRFIRDFRFSESDIAYLQKEVGYEDDFLKFLRRCALRARFVRCKKVRLYSIMNLSFKWKHRSLRPN